MKINITPEKISIDMSKEEWGIFLTAVTGLTYALYTGTPLQVEQKS